MRCEIFGLVAVVVLAGCAEGTTVPASGTDAGASSAEAPWTKHYPVKASGATFCALLGQSSAVFVGKVLTAVPHSDPGGVFKEWTQAADGSTTLATVSIESTMVGAPASPTTILLPGRADPIPGQTFPSTMIPDLKSGDRGIFFVKGHPSNGGWVIVAFGPEGYFPISASGETSNGVLVAHPVKPVSAVASEIAALAADPSSCASSAVQTKGDTVSSGDTAP